jgi:hypothetical protein
MERPKIRSTNSFTNRNLSSRNDRILQWAVDRVRTQYAQDVSLLVVYGSHLTGDETPFSDVDFYLVPKTDRANEVCRTFIIERIGYDLFPMTWGRLASIANFQEPLTPMVGNSRVVFFGSLDDSIRFDEVRKTLQTNLSDRQFMHSRSEDKLRQAFDDLKKLEVADSTCIARVLAGDILLQVADAVAYDNGTYFKRGIKRQMSDLQAMPRLPGGFIVHCDAVIESRTLAAIVEACRTLLTSAAGALGYVAAAENLLATMRRAGTTNPDDFVKLANLYGEIKSTFNKIYYYVQEMNPRLAFLLAVALQKDLDHVKGVTFDLLGEFDAANLPALGATVRSSEAALVSYILSGAKIPSYGSLEQFLSEN